MQPSRAARYQQRLNEKDSHPSAEHDPVDVQQNRHGAILGKGAAKIERWRKTGEYSSDHGRSHDDEEKSPTYPCSFNRNGIHVPTLISFRNEGGARWCLKLKRSMRCPYRNSLQGYPTENSLSR